jgi:hypothetical protein
LALWVEVMADPAFLEDVRVIEEEFSEADAESLVG